jgi:1-deoxy-D-xylulose-5-phosphate reductoisomerase
MIPPERSKQPSGSPRRIVVLGSTGSIGTQALSIVEQNPEMFEVVAIAATGRDPELLAAQAFRHQVPVVAVTDADSVGAIRRQLEKANTNRSGRRYRPDLEVGPESAERVARLDADVVLNGISGAAGLRPTLAALETGTTLALANKESLIIGGPVVKDRATAGQIVPVDSEHSAIAQSLRSGTRGEVQRLILTASGGPFRGSKRADLESVTPEQALAHPTWDMGPLVTINSATMVNKGLELIEAHLLFDIPFDQIDVVVHPQSVVHSMVEFCDGATIAQASPPDMRLPIALGLAWPHRVPGAAPYCDWSQSAQWTFEPVDHDTFPAIKLAVAAGRQGGIAPAVFNAADEVAVAAFLAGRISFNAIVSTIEEVLAASSISGLDNHASDFDIRTSDPSSGAAELRTSGPGLESGNRALGSGKQAGVSGNKLTVDDVLAADEWARRQARAYTSG